MRSTVWLGIAVLAGAGAARAFAAPHTVTFAGRVLDAGGRPARGATVFVCFYDPPRTWRDWGRKPVVHRAVAGAGGSFRLAVPVRSGDWSATLVAVKEGHGPGGQEIASPSRPVGLELSLTRPGVVAGHVVDRAGVPVAGAKVKVRWVWLPGPDGGSLPLELVQAPVTSDAQGRFRIGSLPARAGLNLAAEHPAYALGSGPGRNLTTGMKDVTLTLPRAGAIVGRVLDEAGRPAANARVRCQAIGTPDRVAPTDAAGAFRFDGLAAGYYLIHTAPAGEVPALVAAPQGALVEEGGEARCPDVRLARGGTVSGTVRDDQGRPVAGVGIVPQRDFEFPGRMVTRAIGATGRTGADGTYRLRLAPGKWKLYPQSYPPAYVTDLERDMDGENYPEFAVNPDQTTRADFTLRRATLLRGRVVDAGGRPASRAEVRAQQGDLIVSQRTDVDGRFALRGFLPRETARLTAFSRDRRLGVRLEVPAARMNAEQTVRLQRLPVVAGTVTDREGRPIAGASVGAMRIERIGFGTGGEGINGTTTDAHGRFALAVFPHARYSVGVEAEGFGRAEQFPVDVESAGKNGVVEPPLRLALERADGVLAGVVVDDDGRPLAGAEVSILRRGKTGIGDAISEQAMTDAQGRFRFDHLTPGDVEIWGGMNGYRGGMNQRATVGATHFRLILAPTEGDVPRTADAGAAPGPKVGAPAPALQAARWVNGAGVRSLDELRGKTVVLLISAAFNPAAREWNAALKKLHAQLSAAGRQDVVFLALYDASVSADDAAVYARAEGLPFPIGIVEHTRNLGNDSAAFRAYGVRRLPALFVIDGEGTLRAVDPPREELARLVEKTAPSSRLPASSPTTAVTSPSTKKPAAAFAESREPRAERGSEATLCYTLDPTRDLIDASLGVPLRTAGQALQASDTPPAGVKLPRFVSDRPRFLTATLGDGAATRFVFALDETERGSGHDLLYADGNHNDDLTDEPPLRLTHWRDKTGFKPVRLLIDVGSSRALYHAALVVEPEFGVPAGTPPTYRLQSWGYYSGEAHFGEKTYAVALVDNNGNGRFGDFGPGDVGSEGGDLLLIDVDGDERFDHLAFASPEVIPCARYLSVDGHWYTFSARPDGSRFTVTPAPVEMATLRSAYEGFVLRLASEDGTLTVRSEGGVARVPVGDYRIAGWQLEQRDKDGSVWRAEGVAPSRASDGPALSARGAGRGAVSGDPVNRRAEPRLPSPYSSTVLPQLGAPLQARLEVQSKGGPEREFSLRFTAASGEEIAAVTRSGQLMPEPRLKILDAQGNELADLPFHYG